MARRAISPRFYGQAGRAASVGFMASKPPPSDDKIPASADDPLEPELKEKLAAKPEATNRAVSDKAAAASPSGEDEDDDHELDADEEEDEDLVVFTAKEAAGALA